MGGLFFACIAGTQAQDTPADNRIDFRGNTPSLNGDLQIAQATPDPQPTPSPQAAPSEPQSPPPVDQQSPGGPQIPFHNSTVEMNPIGVAAQPAQPLDGATLGESQKEMDDLSNQKQTLESEILYAQSKLDSARKRLDVESMAGHSEESDKWEQEVRDWDARVKGLRSQEAEIDSQLQSAIQSQQAPASAPDDDIIVPGDNLEIFVVEDSSFNGRYQVRRGGYIIMPAVGRIAVAGKTMSGAEQEVRKALETSQLQHASVMVEKVEGSDIQSGPVIFLSGDFRYPRPFRIPNGTKATVVNLILSCGGVNDSADLTRVRVMRLVANKNVIEEVNVAKILDGSGLTSDLTLTDGDIVIVPSGAANYVFVTGCVARPGGQFIHGSLTVYTAILNAGGFGRFADLKRIYVLRASPDGTKVRIPVNLVAIQHGHSPDLPLTGDDILVIPEKFFSF